MAITFPVDVKHHKVVSILDPAIDEENSDMEAYRKTLDLKHLKFKDGEKPTLFFIKPMTVSEMTEITTMTIDFVEDDKLNYDKAIKLSKRCLELCLEKTENPEIDVSNIDNLQSIKLIMELGSYCQDISNDPLAIGAEKDEKR